MATGRVLVQRDLYQMFLDKLVVKVSSLKIGDPINADVQIGPLINEHQRDNALRVIDTARQAGARVVTGGSHEGLFLSPTVLGDVTPDNPAFRQEIFGPVAVVTPFESDEDAIGLANDTEYGLSMGVISSDVGRALRLGERLRTGLLHINDQTVNSDVINPFGGVGSSGNGTSIGGVANWEKFTRREWLTIKRDKKR